MKQNLLRNAVLAELCQNFAIDFGKERNRSYLQFFISRRIMQVNQSSLSFVAIGHHRLQQVSHHARFCAQCKNKHVQIGRKSKHSLTMPPQANTGVSLEMVFGSMLLSFENWSPMSQS